MEQKLQTVNMSQVKDLAINQLNNFYQMICSIKNVL